MSGLQPPDVVGPGEACTIIGITRPTLMLHKRRPDFPPATHLGIGDVYERRAIVAYGKQRETGKPYLTALSEFRRLGSGPGAIAATAALCAVTPTTIRRYLQQLGEIER